MISGKYLAIFLWLFSFAAGFPAFERFRSGDHTSSPTSRMRVNDMQGSVLLAVTSLGLAVLGIYTWRKDED